MRKGRSKRSRRRRSADTVHNRIDSGRDVAAPCSPEPPTLLYKYLPPERLELWDNFCVRFSRRADLNDPFEFYAEPDQESLEAAFAELETDHALLAEHREKIRGLLPKAPPAIIDHAMQTALQEMRTARTRLPAEFCSELDAFTGENLAVFSCAANASSVPMWAHYAGNHTGYQIGFNPRAFFPVSTPRRDYSLVAQPVSYIRSAPLIRANQSSLFEFAKQKLDDWAYEQEWRYISQITNADRSIGSVYLFDFDPSAIAEVTFGLHASAALISEVTEKMAAAQVSALLFQVAEPKGKFGIIRQPIQS